VAEKWNGKSLCRRSTADVVIAVCHTRPLEHCKRHNHTVFQQRSTAPSMITQCTSWYARQALLHVSRPMGSCPSSCIHHGTLASWQFTHHGGEQSLPPRRSTDPTSRLRPLAECCLVFTVTYVWQNGREIDGFVLAYRWLRKIASSMQESSPKILTSKGQALYIDCSLTLYERS